MQKATVSLHILCTDEAISSLLGDGCLTEIGTCQRCGDAVEEKVVFKCKLRFRLCKVASMITTTAALKWALWLSSATTAPRYFEHPTHPIDMIQKCIVLLHIVKELHWLRYRAWRFSCSCDLTPKGANWNSANGIGSNAIQN